MKLGMRRQKKIKLNKMPYYNSISATYHEYQNGIGIHYYKA